MTKLYVNYINKAVEKLCVYTLYTYWHPDTKSVYIQYANTEAQALKSTSLLSMYTETKTRWMESIQDRKTLECKRLCTVCSTKRHVYTQTQCWEH